MCQGHTETHPNLAQSSYIILPLLCTTDARVQTCLEQTQTQFDSENTPNNSFVSMCLENDEKHPEFTQTVDNTQTPLHTITRRVLTQIQTHFSYNHTKSPHSRYLYLQYPNTM